MFCDKNVFYTCIVELPCGSVIKNLSANQETWIRSLGGDLLEKEMATYSSILAWEVHRQRSLQSTCHKGVRHDLVTKQQQTHILTL